MKPLGPLPRLRLRLAHRERVSLSVRDRGAQSSHRSAPPHGAAPSGPGGKGETSNSPSDRFCPLLGRIIHAKPFWPRLGASRRPAEAAPCPSARMPRPSPPGEPPPRFASKGLALRGPGTQASFAPAIGASSSPLGPASTPHAHAQRIPIAPFSSSRSLFAHRRGRGVDDPS